MFNFSKALKVNLDTHGYKNLLQFTDATGICYETVSRLKNSAKGGYIRTLQDIADAFGVSLSDFIKGGEL